jgi:hypothetical protein
VGSRLEGTVYEHVLVRPEHLFGVRRVPQQRHLEVHGQSSLMHRQQRGRGRAKAEADWSRVMHPFARELLGDPEEGRRHLQGVVHLKSRLNAVDAQAVERPRVENLIGDVGPFAVESNPRGRPRPRP